MRTKKTFLENPALSNTTSYGFVAPWQNLEKTNDIIPRKSPNEQKDEGRAEPILQDSSGHCHGSNKLGVYQVLLDKENPDFEIIENLNITEKVYGFKKHIFLSSLSHQKFENDYNLNSNNFFYLF